MSLFDNSREKLFYAHKGILASSSPVFESMLTNEKEEDKIKLCQTNHSAFLALLTFIYTFNVNITSLYDAENLLVLADKFEIFPVREECLRYFRLELNVDNVWGIWAIAANVNSEEKIYELVVRWANYSYSLDSDTSSTRNSTNTQVEKVLPPSSSNSTSASMPSELPENFEDAVNDMQIVENALHSLLKCVRFPVMKKQYIFEKVEGNPLIMAVDGMKDLVIEAYWHLLMLEVPNSDSSNRVKHRR
ncbi:2775_t:CDS:2, partial [Funneliformis geosporum]